MKQGCLSLAGVFGVAGVAGLTVLVCARRNYNKRIQHALSVVDSFQSVPKSAKEAQQRGVRILSIDGGGVRGIIPALFLKDLEERLSERNGRKEHLGDHFDLVCGTSTGGLIALAHVKARLSFSDICKLYRTGAIFDTPYGYLSRFASLLGIGALYSSLPLEKLLKRVLMEDLPMVEVDSDPKVFVVAYEAISTEAKTYLLTSYKGTEKLNRPVLSSCRTWEAARATSAAPFYFSPIIVDGVRLVDGGIDYNNPVNLAIEQARVLWPDRPIDCVLSIGTGEQSVKALPESSLFSNVWLLYKSIAKSKEALITAKNMGYKVTRFNTTGIDCKLDETDQRILDVVESRTQSCIQEQFETLNDFVVHLLQPEPVMSPAEVLLLRFDAYQDSGYEDSQVANIAKVTRFQHVEQAIPHEYRLSHGQNDRYWTEWTQCIADTVKKLHNMPKVPSIVVAGKSPISLALLLGLEMKNVPQVSFVNQNMKDRSWEKWDLTTARFQHSSPVFDQPTFEKVGNSGKIVLFLSLDPMRIYERSRTSQITQQLRSHGDKSPEVALVARMEHAGNDRLEVHPDMVNQIRKEFQSFVCEAEKQFPHHSGIVVASALPLPLNYLLGTLLNVQTHHSISFVENVGNEYCLAWSSVKK